MRTRSYNFAQLNTIFQNPHPSKPIQAKSRDSLVGETVWNSYSRLFGKWRCFLKPEVELDLIILSDPLLMLRVVVVSSRFM